MLVQGGIENTSFLHKDHRITALNSVICIHTVSDCSTIQIFCKYFVNNFDYEGATPVMILTVVPFCLFVPGKKGQHSSIANLGHG